ncbi:MAG: hypothetical protein KGY78_08850 [Anaerolineae bacterium]|nr:hypothetical protein [Anaerolineae bacterium]
MNVERKADGGRGGLRGRPRSDWSQGIAALLSVGVLASVLVVSLLLTGTASAAPVADVACELCGEASDPVQYSFLARGERSAASIGAVNAVPSVLGNASDPVQVSFAASRSAKLARDAEIARLRGLAGPGAGSWAGVDESVHLRALAEAALSGTAESDCAALSISTRSEMASAARLIGIAEIHLGRELEEARARLAEAALSGTAESDCAALSIPTRSEMASAARLIGIAEIHLGRELEEARARLAEAALSGTAESDCAALSISTRSEMASAARLIGIAEIHLGRELEEARAPRLNQARLAEAGRLTALAAHLGIGSDAVSPMLACLTDS